MRSYGICQIYLAALQTSNPQTFHLKLILKYLSSLLLSRSVMSDSLWPHGLQQARLPCPSPSPGACSNSCPLSRWCHPTISSSAASIFCLQSFPVPGSQRFIRNYQHPALLGPSSLTKSTCFWHHPSTCLSPGSNMVTTVPWSPKASSPWGVLPFWNWTKSLKPKILKGGKTSPNKYGNYQNIKSKVLLEQLKMCLAL